MIRKFGNVQGISDQVLGIDAGSGVNTADATATAAQILAPQTAYGATGLKLTGAMPENGTINITPNSSSQTIPAGHTSGGSVAAVVVPVANVLAGTTIAGQAGTMPENGTLNYNPSTGAQSIPTGHTSGGTINPVTGTAAVGDVVNGKTFSSGNGTNLTGTGASAKREASGSGTADGNGFFSVSGLTFTPKLIRVDVTATNTDFVTYLAGSTINNNLFCNTGNPPGTLTTNWSVSAGSFSFGMTGRGNWGFNWTACE